MFRLFFLFLFFSFFIRGQVAISFGLFKDSLIEVPIQINPNDSLAVFRFYISDLRITESKTKHWKAQKRHYLIDFNSASAKEAILLQAPQNLINGQIEFVLGVDSKTCAGGIGEGVLDPINGMYWTWQSGYINFKMEGVSNKSPARKNRFQLHLGGYRKPYTSIQKVVLDFHNSGSETEILFDLVKFMKSIDLKNQHTIMSPSKEAVALSKLAKSCFYVK